MYVCCIQSVYMCIHVYDIYICKEVWRYTIHTYVHKQPLVFSEAGTLKRLHIHAACVAGGEQCIAPPLEVGRGQVKSTESRGERRTPIATIHCGSPACVYTYIHMHMFGPFESTMYISHTFVVTIQ